MLVRGDHVAMPGLAPARATHRELDPAVDIGAHLLHDVAAGRVGLRRLLGEHAVADDRAAALPHGGLAPLHLDGQIRKNLRSRHEGRKGMPA